MLNWFVSRTTVVGDELLVEAILVGILNTVGGLWPCWTTWTTCRTWGWAEAWPAGFPAATAGGSLNLKGWPGATWVTFGLMFCKICPAGWASNVFPSAVVTKTALGMVVGLGPEAGLTGITIGCCCWACCWSCCWFDDFSTTLLTISIDLSKLTSPLGGLVLLTTVVGFCLWGLAGLDLKVLGSIDGSMLTASMLILSLLLTDSVSVASSIEAIERGLEYAGEGDLDEEKVMELPLADLTEAGEFTDAADEVVSNSKVLTSGVETVGMGWWSTLDTLTTGRGVDTGVATIGGVSRGVAIVGEGIEMSSSIL